jgi:phosphate acetyltransferase
VNDLSRGCLVEDIVFTINLTAIQAQQVAKLKANALVMA